GLGDAGRAGGVDVERAIVNRDRTRYAVARYLGRKLRDERVDTRTGVGVRAVNPDRWCANEVLTNRDDAIEQRLGDDHVFWRRDVDAVRQRRTREVGVDQRDDTADARDA